MSNLIELTRSDIRTLKRDYNSGMSMSDVADAWGLGISTVRRLLTVAGVTIRPHGRQPQN